MCIYIRFIWPKDRLLITVKLYAFTTAQLQPQLQKFYKYKMNNISF
jgi:hypothetical protein